MDALPMLRIRWFLAWLTCSKEEAQEWKAEIEERFPGYEIMEGSLSLSVACHIGPGALAITCMKRL